MDAPSLLMPDPSAAQLAAVALAALVGSIVGGLSGQGTGLILPAFVAPVVGIANVIPVMSVATLMTNMSRLAAFWRDIDHARVRQVLLTALPATALGAFVFTRMDTRLAGLALGGFLILSVPLRRLLARARYTLRGPGLALASAGHGLLTGGMTGTGLLMLSILMAAGVHGLPLIASDAAISTLVNITKILVFGSSSLYDARLLTAGVLIGLCTLPGAFIARWLMERMSLRIHGLIMDGVVLLGGASLMWRSLG